MTHLDDLSRVRADDELLDRLSRGECSAHDGPLEMLLADWARAADHPDVRVEVLPPVPARRARHVIHLGRAGLVAGAAASLLGSATVAAAATGTMPIPATVLERAPIVARVIGAPAPRTATTQLAAETAEPAQAPTEVVYRTTYPVAGDQQVATTPDVLGPTMATGPDRAGALFLRPTPARTQPLRPADGLVVAARPSRVAPTTVPASSAPSHPTRTSHVTSAPPTPVVAAVSPLGSRSATPSTSPSSATPSAGHSPTSSTTPTTPATPTTSVPSSGAPTSTPGGVPSTAKPSTTPATSGAPTRPSRATGAPRATSDATVTSTSKATRGARTAATAQVKPTRSTVRTGAASTPAPAAADAAPTAG